MRVTAQLFNPPGRGEFFRQALEIPDSAKPTSAAEFSLRSVRAVKHFWPSALVSKAAYISHEDGFTLVDGGTWQVQWETAAYAADYDKFMARFATCEEGCNQELFARAASLKEEKV